MKANFRSKVNPRKIPRTQADVDKAWEDGVLAGCTNSAAIFLTVCVDKFGMTQEEIVRMWNEINKLSESIAERRVSVADLKHTLLDEYGIRV